MKITASILNEFDFSEYREFLDRCEESMIYYSPEYIETIAKITNSDRPRIVVARRESRIIGALVILTITSHQTTIANSMPYFGSHGDILIDSTELDKQEIADCIADWMNRYIQAGDIAAINIVSHPQKSWIERAALRMGLRAWDHRIGQISYLPEHRDPEAALNAILANCHQKTRNLVRKGLRQNFEIEVSDDAEDWNEAITHHRAGMERIGGRAKTQAEFDAIRNGLPCDTMRKLFVAKKNGEFAGALLNLYYRDWVEYFIPVAVDKFRSDQVLSALIAHAMIAACSVGLRKWNWGGTWTTQAGVYHFKQGWGAIDHPYKYFGAVRDPKIVATSAEHLISQFPFFYVKPFNVQV